ncbi:uncharacterized protein LOC130648881 isoform X2 [Hydractinia symbiolongicarpus]|uniref:uncharacterized protein LOC130648881 isoform X2 n=1 Tax=Hydractinia symbiolongicarpus TaxID=13093 RepID=UPI0025518E99|nr:uncharacterized protein LOC130648881 isoform X2 [Hydractinia symbiolongicarpus]
MEDSNTSGEFKEALISFCKIHHVMTLKTVSKRCNELSLHTYRFNRDDKKQLADLINEHDWCIAAKVIIKKCYKGLGKMIEALRKDKNVGKYNMEADVIHTTFDIIANFTDFNEGCMRKCVSSNLMYTILKYVFNMIKDIMETEDNQSYMSYLRESVMTIVYNCSRTPYNKEWYQDATSLKGIPSENLNSRYFSEDNEIIEEKLNTITSVQSMVSNIQEISHAITSKWRKNAAGIGFVQSYHLCAVLTMAHLYQKDENNTSTTEKGIISCMFEYIRESLSVADFQCEGFSLEEMLNGLGRVAANTENQSKMVDAGVFDVVLEVLQSDGIPLDAIAEALKVLWQLSFEYSNLIKENIALCDIIHKLKDNDQNEVSENAAGIEWELHKNLTVHNVLQNQAKHIMISYSWKQKKIVKDIVNKLKKCGFKVWFDEDDMTEELCAAMAYAIQNAEVFLLFASRTYQESPNCKSEATYARERKVKIIPIILEEGWRPEDWLGFMISDKYYIAIPESNPSLISKKFTELKELLDGHHKMKINYIDVVDACEERSMEMNDNASAKKDFLSDNWDEVKTKEWMEENNITLMPQNSGLNGKQLKFLYELMDQHPSLFYKFLNDDFGLVSFCHVSNFVIALQNLYK